MLDRVLGGSTTEGIMGQTSATPSHPPTRPVRARGRGLLSVGWSRMLVAVALLACASVALTMQYQSMRSGIEADIYRQRLEALARDYATLRSTFNEAVRRTAVTELVVREGKLSVRVRTATGVEQEVATPFDPSTDIYVNYIVANGRLWVRSIYDRATGPEGEMVIDPALGQIEWSDEDYGLAVYRPLSEGRWIISITGGGSMGLKRLPLEDDPPELAATPPVRDYDEMQEEIDAQVGSISIRDIWKRITEGVAP